ncbi:MAG: ribosomal RNA small subunit methyltransferase A [Planctomycetes bacterium]|nr:ribosomal RNA small subunit methyltransferase A [Planctomycetota bacterium]MCC7170281.1 ribosomal RNA small subunit methyltransferase A [Planctomycetota bacterium]
MTANVRVPTLAQIREALGSVDAHPRKRFGQHFLTDPNLLQAIAAAADVGPGDRVLEVGPGPGALTATLLSRGAHVLAVDIDRTMLGVLARLVGAVDTLEVAELDVLERGRLHPELLQRLSAFCRGGAYKLVSNLPYNVASPLLIELWKHRPPSVGSVLVQREVGERIAAIPGGPDVGVLSVQMQWRAETALVRKVSAGSFWPPPRVESAVVKLVTRAQPLYEQDDPAAAESLLKIAFQHRRKTLANALKDALPTETVERAGALSIVVGEFDGNRRRPEALAPMEWVTLARRLARRS